MTFHRSIIKVNPELGLSIPVYGGALNLTRPTLVVLSARESVSAPGCYATLLAPL